MGLAAMATVLACVAPASAETPRPRDVVSAEILPGWTTADGTRMAALHLTLAEHWKTYWRAPGEAGIPPSFDWQGSQNLASASVHWPRPTLFDLNGIRTIGYMRELVLPIELRPADPSRPLSVAARIDIGVCRDICMPVSLNVAGDLGGSGEAGRPRDARILAALADRPLSAAEAGLTRLRCRIDPIADGMRVTAEIEMPALDGPEVAVFETGSPDVWVSESESHRSGRVLTAAADLVPPEGAPFALDRSSLRVTLLGRGKAVDLQGCPG